MSMSKKDFIALADMIREHNRFIIHSDEHFTAQHLDTLASFCKRANSNFMRDRWLAYIAGECAPNPEGQVAEGRHLTVPVMPRCSSQRERDGGNMESVLTRNQKKVYGPRPISGWGKNAQIKAEVRYDDQCGNGHNSFAVTGEIFIPGRRDCEACGCLHDEVAKHFPELAPFIKWHLVSSDEPMHYVANTLYWLGYSGWCDGKPTSPPNLEYARSTAVWPDMPETFLADPERIANGEVTKESVKAALQSRVETLRAEFKQAVESLGFVF